jgi:hypothetical protein
MTTYVEINGNQYPAVITGRLSDKEWGNRASKAIKLEMTYVDALEIFVDDVSWNIVQDVEIVNEVEDEEGIVIRETVVEQESYDNSEYCIAGSITDNRDGTVTVKMGKPTAEELLAMFEEVL